MKPEIVNIGEPSADLIDFPQLIRDFARYKWGILGLTILSAAAAALVTFSLRPMYTGKVALLVESQNQHVATLRDVYDTEMPEFEFLGAQLAVLKSRELARRAVDRLDLVNNPEFAPKAGPLQSVDLRRYLPFLPDPASFLEPVPEAQRREEVIDDFLERLTVEPYGRTRVINVQFEAYSAELAAQVANTLADLFIESGLEARLEATTKATSWLTDKLAEIQKNLQTAEAELQRFREQEQLVNVGGARSLTEEEVSDYSKRLREAQRKRIELQSTYQKIREAGADPQRLRDISTLLIDPVVQRANNSYLEAQEAVKALEDRYGPRHPQMTTAKARLATAEAALNEQLKIAARGIRAEYEIALDSERAAAQQLEASRTQIRQLDRKDYELSVLQRNVTTYRELYNTFLARFKETDVAGSYQAISARVIDPAVVPYEPSSPQKKRIILLATIGGFALGIVLAILHHLLNDGVRSAEELEALGQMPVLGVLPLVSGLAGRKQNLPKYFIEKAHTPFSEGMRSTCAALRLSDAGSRLKRIVVSSSVPAEGKSSVSSALALTLAATDKVVLVETDLRKPSLRKLFGLPADAKGLTHALDGECPLDECLHWHEQGSIWILPAGKIPKNSTELLASAPFAELLAELNKRFTRVVLDSPPVQSAADALVLGRQADGLLFVVKSDATTRRAVKNSLKQLRLASIPVIGLLVNQVDVRRNSHYADSYHYVYGYYG
ncbi:polysaccharide biosynthesis tyrosine autokinase [Fontimonas sp. SYSU GA230001]|uniref:GumC family protein n=1 Tax=Fontimonas sp. SYSU GA230001 TaxID=3142450 RepID=UPI0032B5FAB7